MINQERTMCDWKELLINYEHRNCSRNTWCKKNNVTVSQLKYWKSKININQSEANVEALTSSNWLQLSSLEDNSTINDKITGDSNPKIVLEINGMSIKIGNNFDPNTLKQLIEVIKSC